MRFETSIDVALPASLVWVYTPLVVPEYRRYPTTAGSESGSQARVTSAWRRGARRKAVLYNRRMRAVLRRGRCIVIRDNVVIISNYHTPPMPHPSAPQSAADLMPVGSVCR